MIRVLDGTGLISQSIMAQLTEHGDEARSRGQTTMPLHEHSIQQLTAELG